MKKPLPEQRKKYSFSFYFFVSLFLILIRFKRPEQLIKGYENGNKTKKEHPYGEMHLAHLLNFQTRPRSQTNDGAHLEGQSNIFYIVWSIISGQLLFCVLHRYRWLFALF